ncbi:MAG: hypothetical protein ACTSXD_02080 [Candidatus Heimdallarchaeaceae archaeon]
MYDENLGYITSSKDFNLFRKECDKWIEVFGLKDWYVYYVHYDNIEDSGAYGSCSASINTKCAEISLYKNLYDNYYDEHIIKRTAFHEVCELLFIKIKFFTVTDTKVQEREIEEELHTIIRRLENSLFEKSCNQVSK